MPPLKKAATKAAGHHHNKNHDANGLRRASPSDERLLTKSSETPQESLKIRAKFWGDAEAVEATADLSGKHPMKRAGDSHVWAG